MLAVRRRLDDCSCLSLLGTARGDTWWQVSEASWDRPRGTGPGFWRESHTAGHAIARRFGVNGVVRNLAGTRHCARARARATRPAIGDITPRPFLRDDSDALLGIYVGRWKDNRGMWLRFELYV